MRLRTASILLISVVAVACLGQLQTQPAYQQSIKTSTTYSTQVLTVATTETSRMLRTIFVTVTIPKAPVFEEKHSWTIWYWPATGLLAKAEIKGNITNLSEHNLFDVMLKFELGEGDKSEEFGHLISWMKAGQRVDFHFDYEPKGQYKYQWTWLRYRGVSRYAGVSFTTFTQTSTIVEESKMLRTATLTTVHTILSAYTEPAVSTPEGSLLMIMAIITIAAVAIAVVIVLRSKSARKVSAPTTAVQPETTIREVPVPQPVRAGKVCPKCQTANESEAKFCVNCGYRL